MHSADYVCPSVCLFVRPSVRHTPVLSLNGYTYPQCFFSQSGSPTILVFPYQTGYKYSDRDLPNGGAEFNESMKKARCSTNIGLYLGTDATYSRSYYVRRIGNRTKTFEWYQFE